MKRPSLLMTLSVLHSLIWSAGVFAVFQVMSMMPGRAVGPAIVWGATLAMFVVILLAHLLIGGALRKRMALKAPRNEAGK